MAVPARIPSGRPAVPLAGIPGCSCWFALVGKGESLLMVIGDHLTGIWPWWFGGAVIGLLVPVLYYFFNVGLGVSTGYASLIRSAVSRPRLRWFGSSEFADRWSWRLFFLLGIMSGSWLANHLAGGHAVSSELGLLTERLDWPIAALGLLLVAGGFLMGLGARLAGGCTSGHSIHGLATLQWSSFLITLTFLAFGVLSANAVRLFLFSGVGL